MLIFPVFAITDPFMFNFVMSLVMGMVIIGMPVMLPIMIAADSIVGEKERNTLIPLLATPLTNTELLLGKFLTAMVPGIAVAYGNLILVTGLVNGLALFLAPSVFLAWPTGLPLLQSLVMPWLFSFLGVGIMVIISQRVSKVYEAYQSAGVLILPAFIFAYSGFLQGTGIDWLIFVIGAGILALVNLGLFRVATKLFDRDKMVTRL